jgi:prepilin-type N-terminal cleavage/methylation domain-containing protein
MKERGFTLIEFVVVIVLMGVGLVSLASMFGQVATTLPANTSIQMAAQAAQACSEHALESRRSGQVSFANVDATICNDLPAVSGFTRSVAVTDISAAGDPCPDTTAGTCKQLLVTLTGGGTTITATTMLVDY